MVVVGGAAVVRRGSWWVGGGGWAVRLGVLVVYGVGWGCSIFPNGVLAILVGIVCWGMLCLCHLGLLGECDIGVAGVSFGAVGRLGQSGLGHIGNRCRRVGIQ